VDQSKPHARQRHARVLAFGEVLWDNLPDGLVLGGAPANFAGRVQSLGESVALVSRVGKDALGEETIVRLRKMGLDTDYVQQDQEHKTGTVEVDVDSVGSASLYTFLENSAWDYIACNKNVRAAAEHAQLVYFGTLAQRNEVSRAALEDIFKAAPSATKLLDVNLRVGCYTPETVDSSLHKADILKLNDAEVDEIGNMLGFKHHSMEAFCDAVVKKHGVKLCLVTRGAMGVFARTEDGQAHDIPGFDVSVVDTVGAGDAFTAGFVWSYIRGGTVQDSCEIGNRLGAMVATQRGGTVPVTVAELMAFGKLERTSAK
jgi:fructokinase